MKILVINLLLQYNNIAKRKFLLAPSKDRKLQKEIGKFEEKFRLIHKVRVGE